MYEFCVVNYIGHKSHGSLVCGVVRQGAAAPSNDTPVCRIRVPRKHLVCMRTRSGSKTLWNWLPIQFTGGRKRKQRAVSAAPARSRRSRPLQPPPSRRAAFNLLSYSLSPSIFIIRSSVRFAPLPRTCWYLALAALCIIRSSWNEPPCLTPLITHLVPLYPFCLNSGKTNLDVVFTSCRTAARFMFHWRVLQISSNNPIVIRYLYKPTLQASLA